MAIRVENDGVLSFGVMENAHSITHVRFSRGTVNVTIALDPAVAVGAGERLRIPDDGFDIVYPSGALTDAHMDALVKAYWDGNAFAIDALTNATTVVSDTGYSQISNSSWTFTTEADPS